MYRRRQENILYPETSVLDEYLASQGLHKKLSKNIKIVNGEVKFVRAKQPKKGEKGEDDDGRGKNNFFNKKKEEK